jgi:DNA-binding NarL/FixJ family response regulator
MSQPISRVVIVDDHPLVRRGLIDLISREPDLSVVGEAGSVAEAMQAIEATLPDVVLLDISLDDGNGLELIRWLVSRFRETKIVVISMHDELLMGERCLDAGAMGYINKDEATERVVESIRTVLTGKKFTSSRLTSVVAHGVEAPTTDINRVEVMDGLTDREYEVFSLIGRGLAIRQIAAAMHLSHKTVESYRESIKAKFAVTSSAEIARLAIQLSNRPGE